MVQIKYNAIPFSNYSALQIIVFPEWKRPKGETTCHCCLISNPKKIKRTTHVVIRNNTSNNNILDAISYFWWKLDCLCMSSRGKTWIKHPARTFHPSSHGQQAHWRWELTRMLASNTFLEMALIIKKWEHELDQHRGWFLISACKSIQ